MFVEHARIGPPQWLHDIRLAGVVAALRSGRNVAQAAASLASRPQGEGKASPPQWIEFVKTTKP